VGQGGATKTTEETLNSNKKLQIESVSGKKRKTMKKKHIGVGAAKTSGHQLKGRVEGPKKGGGKNAQTRARLEANLPDGTGGKGNAQSGGGKKKKKRTGKRKKK